MVAVRETIEAVIAPPNSSRSSASACAIAEPSLSAVALTKPSPSTIPSGVFAGMLRLVESLPDTRTGATRPSVPVITAAVARAGDCAGADETSAAAATATTTAVAMSRVRT